MGTRPPILLLLYPKPRVLQGRLIDSPAVLEVYWF